MGRGQGSAEELFYGDEMSTMPASAPREAGDISFDEKAWALVNELFLALNSTKRDPFTMKPDPDGVFLVGTQLLFCILEDEDIDDYDEHFSLGIMEDEGGPVLVANVYEWEDDEQVVLDNIYIGRSLEEALMYCRRYCEREGKSGPGDRAGEDLLSSLEEMIQEYN